MHARLQAEDVRIGADGDTAAIVHAVENHGVEKVVTLKVGNQLIRATVAAAVPIAVDAPVRFSLNSGRLHYFDAGSGASLI